MNELLLRNTPGGALAALIIFAVVAVWRGWLVPRSTLRTLDTTRGYVEAVQEKRLAESVAREQEWKAAWLTAEQARQLQAAQIGDLLELAKTTDAFIRGLRTVTKGEL